MSQKTKHVVVLSGAGISAESGIKTFRDAGGLWEGHRVEDVATPEAWQRNPQLVLDFYNQRRRQLYQVEPNPGHRAIAELERRFRVSMLTQNVDNLHERAGSSRGWKIGSDAQNKDPHPPVNESRFENTNHHEPKPNDLL